MNPIIAAVSQLFILTNAEIVVIYGDKVLPTIPKILVHP